MVSKRKVASPKAAAKKQKKGDKKVEKSECEQNIEILMEAIGDDEYDIPGTESNRALLLNVIEKAMSVPIEHRHEWQITMIQCVTDAVTSIRRGLDDRVAEIQNLINNADSIREGLIVASKEKDEQLEVKMAALQASLEISKQKTEVSKEAKKILKDAMDAEQEKRDDAVQYAELKESFEQAQEEFEKLRNGDVQGKQADKLMKSLMTVLEEEMELDSTLLAAAPKALCKDPSKRGCFDGMSIEHIQEQLVQHRAKNETDIAESDSRIATEVENVRQKQEAYDLAVDEQTQAKSVENACLEDKKNATSECKASTKAISDHDKDVKNAERDLVNSQQVVVDFERIQAAHQWLLNFTEIVPEEPVQVEEPVQTAEGDVREAADIADGKMEHLNESGEMSSEIPVAEGVVHLDPMMSMYAQVPEELC